MEVSRILVELDKEISRLQQARTLLSGSSDSSVRRKPGRKSAAGKAPTAKTPTAKVDRRKGPRKLSAEAKRSIGEAMKKRWAERKKLAASKGSK